MKQGLEYLRALAPLGMTGNLNNMERLLSDLGHPERAFRTIHVVGTDGKGSTAFYLSNILAAHGISTGLYTSPHLVNVRERIRVGGVPIPEEDFDRLLLRVKEAAAAASLRASFFEAVTLAGFLHFAEKRVGAAVVEAGLGGRLDATKTARGELAVLTSIGLEHTELLGQTEPAILHEKLGVLSPDATVIVGGIGEALWDDAREFVKSIPAKILFPRTIEDLEVPNPGKHYVENASLAFAAAQMFLKENFDETKARVALKSSLWAGRMQRLVDPDGRFRFLLDGAHNPHAVKRLSESLAAYHPGKKFHCIFGALRDKAIDEMIPMLSPFVSEWHVTRTPYPRFREIEDVSSELESFGCRVGFSGSVSAGFLKSVERSAQGPVLVTGSLYLIGEVVNLLKNEFDGLKFFRNLELSENERHGREEKCI